MQKLIIIFIICLIFTLGVGSLVWAQDGVGTDDGTKTGTEDGNKVGTEPDAQTEELDNPLGETSTFPDIIGRIIKAFLGIIGTISLIMFIYGGFLMLTSAGKAEQIKKGQQTLVWASLGILVVFASYAILKFVFSAFGL